MLLTELGVNYMSRLEAKFDNRSDCQIVLPQVDSKPTSTKFYSNFSHFGLFIAVSYLPKYLSKIWSAQGSSSVSVCQQDKIVVCVTKMLAHLHYQEQDKNRLVICWARC